MQDLLPGGTAVVALTDDGAYSGFWRLDCPTLVLKRIEHLRLRKQVFGAIAAKLGRRPEDHTILNVKTFLKTHRVQVVMGEYLDWSTRWLGLVQELGLKFFVHAHGYDVSMLLRHTKWRERYLSYNLADGVITFSDANKARLVALGLDAGKIHTIPYGVDIPAQPLRRVETDTIRCIAVGRMVAKKAPILTLEAFRRAAQECPKLRLDYVGAGELFAAAQQFIHAFDLGGRVTLHGAQPNEEVRRLMRETDIFLQHSMTDPETGDEEGLPVAILEAMANSLPVLSTYHAGIPEAVLDSGTGYLVEEGDVAGMAERLLTLTRDPDLRRRMGEAGLLRVKEHFSWEKERAALLGVLGLDRRYT